MESDEKLLARVRSGDMAAFDTLYERYETRLFAYLRALLLDRRDAEEVMHDAFLAALRSETEVVGDGGFRAWLYRIARNLALNHARGAQRRERHLAVLAASDGERTAPSAQRTLESRQLEAALASAVTRLPAPLGELFHLRSSGLSYEQIADVFEVPLGTVKSRMHQMVHALREELKPWIVPQ